MKNKNFSKDQIQKIILSTLGFIGLIYCYFTFFLGPLDKSRAEMTQEIAATQEKTASSRTEMRKTANLELQAKEATSRFEALKKMTQSGAPIAWFPPKMRNFFAAQGIDKAGVKLATSSSYKEPEMSDWVRDTWAIDLPTCDYETFGKALAELENSQPLLAVEKISIRAVPEAPQFQQASLTAHIALFAQ
jgi:hypothetical protein